MKPFSYIGQLIRRYASMGILVCLLLSTALWYVIKLSYTYTTTVPVAVTVEGVKIKVLCTVEATGYRLVANRYIGGDIDITLVKAEAVPSAVVKDGYILNSFALQNVISKHRSDMKVIAVSEIPDVVIHKTE